MTRCALCAAPYRKESFGRRLALWRLAPEFNLEDSYLEEELANRILHVALKAPLRQIMENAGLDADDIMDKDDLIDDINGFDVKNEVYGDMYKMGVIDPLKVTKNALINAASVATTILSTNAIVTHARA